MRNRRITMACFRTCPTCRSRSQPGFYHCAPRLVSNQPEPSFARLRCCLGGDRPSQTTRQAVSPGRLHGPGLDARHREGGISTAAPPPPEGRLPSLPPMLRAPRRASLPSCSQGARGLSVLWRVTGVFTGTTTSPGWSSRQRSDRYAIRAGRNLPDKEFRYLRTVIVTAAVHRGFDSRLRRSSPLLLTFRHRAGVSPYTSCSTLQRPVFLLNSRLSRFPAAPSRGRPFSRSYGASLPSSWTTNHPSA